MKKLYALLMLTCGFMLLAVFSPTQVQGSNAKNRRRFLRKQ